LLSSQLCLLYICVRAVVACNEMRERPKESHMNMPRTILTSIVAVAVAMYSPIELADAAPRLHKQSVKTSLRLGTQDGNGSSRALGITMCDPGNQLVSENLDMATVTPGNSVNCFGGFGTPEHRYGRSHDLSLGSTAGLPLEISCIHFALAHNEVAGTATANVYLDFDGVPGPTSDESDLLLLGSVDVPIPVTSVPVMIAFTPIIPFPLNPDSLIFIEIVIPASSGTNEIGSNAGGELSVTWLRTTNGECGIGTWTNPATLGFPNMHMLEAIEIAEATIPDPCDSPLADCVEDVDGDGIVAVSDVLMIIGSWGDCGDGTFRPTGDIAPLPNGDCCVDVVDILAVIGAWGVECDSGGIDGFGINEIRIDMSGTDYNEYIELIGDAGFVLDGYSYIVIGDGVGGSGVLETIVDLTGAVIGVDGLLSIGRPDMTIAIPDLIIDGFSLENSDNVTHLLVNGLVAELNQDLDADDDGILDAVYWSELIDEVGLMEIGYEGEIVELLYTDIILGPVGIYPPAHVFRCPDGGGWNLGVFANLAMDTPGEPNMCDVPDMDEDGVFDLVDNCYLPNPDQLDCNGNGVGDVCDIADGTSSDCNSNGLADDCEDDCDSNGLPDDCDIANGAVDCDGNGIPDVCDADCNDNGVVDSCDIADGTSTDENGNGVPDECEVGTLFYTSFEEPTLGGQYVDLGDPLVDHQLFNNDGQANVEWVASGAEMGFTAWYVNTRDGVGLTDGDYVGVTDYTGSGVGSYPDGANGYQISDCDGLMRVDFDTATGLGDWNVSLELFIAETGWEDEDAIVIDVVVDGGIVISLLDTTGSDIDDLGIEGAWFNLLQDLSGYTEATLRISLDSNAGTEAIFVDNVVFSSNVIEDSDGDGIPDSQDNCDLYNPDQLDCNANGVGDVCDLADGVSFDCNANGVPDECEADCNSNGVPDECDIANGTSQDADGNGIPDECEVVNEYLVITGVVDGPLSGGTPKAIELYVISDIADLSLYGLGSANNGGGSDGEEFTFDAVSASAGQFIYVASESENFLAFFGFSPDFVHSAANINGDDAIELFENGNVIDTFGDINTDGTGEPWEYLDGWVSRISQTGPDGVIFVFDSWTYSGIDALDGETSNGTAVLPFPVGAYSQ